MQSGKVNARLPLITLPKPTTIEENKKYAAQLEQIDDLDTLTQLVNQLLTAETLAEFEQKLLGYLPKDEPQK